MGVGVMATEGWAALCVRCGGFLPEGKSFVVRGKRGALFFVCSLKCRDAMESAAE